MTDGMCPHIRSGGFMRLDSSIWSGAIFRGDSWPLSQELRRTSFRGVRGLCPASCVPCFFAVVSDSQL
eukprot:7112662-Pyramimonas_sp.AAC.1